MADDRPFERGRVQGEADFVKAVVERLRARARLHQTAREIAAGLAPAAPEPPALLGEASAFRICNAGGVPAGENVRFDCAVNDFECGTFACATAFSRCVPAESGSSFECERNFSCTVLVGDKKVDANAFDCRDFACGTTDPGSYNCANDVDFLCEGDDFECEYRFICSAGHGFFCTDDHDCEDFFSCRSSGVSTVPCPARYARPDDGGTEQTPGDFLCGALQHANGDEDFGCSDTFNCTATSDFDCDEFSWPSNPGG